MKIKFLFLHIIKTARQAIKEHQSSPNPIIRLCVSIFYVFWNAVKTAKLVCINKDFRSISLLQLLNSKKVHQTTSLTFMNRYPKIFSACQTYFDTKLDLKILSYGCSTGEEVLTLRQYFPNAHIIGAEINKRSLEICRKLPVDEKITFLYSKLSKIQKYGPFDAIFCMAVFQRTPHHIAIKGISSLKRIYPFEKFEQQIIELDKLMNLQGLLVIHFTQYSLLDTSIAPKYIPFGNCNQDAYKLPVFDKSSNLVKNPVSQNSIFIKLLK